MSLFTRVWETVQDFAVDLWTGLGEKEEGGAEVGSNKDAELQSVLAVDNDDFQEEFGDDSEEGFLVLPRRPRDKPPREGGGRGRGNSTDADSVGLRQRTERAAENGASSSNEGEGGAEGVEPGRAAEKKPPPPRMFLEWSSCAAAPVRMKNAQAVFYEGQLYVGGGFTGRSKTDATMYTYDVTFNHWNTLRTPTPLKWFGLAVFNKALVLIGGRETKSPAAECSNRLASWDSGTSEWVKRLPSMAFARTTPTVFTRKSLLVVGGGQKGALDYSIEVLDASTMQWRHAAPPPLRISPFHSLVHGGFWYLLRSDPGCTPSLQCADIDSFLEPTLPDSHSAASRQALWREHSPLSLISPFRIAAVGDTLIVFLPSTSNAGNLAVHAFFPDSQTWSYIGKVPGLCENSSAAVTPKGELILIGGDGGNFGFSDKVYKVFIRTTPKSKKRARVVLPV